MNNKMEHKIDIKFRILNKNKSGVVINIFNQEMEYTWAEFNTMFVVEDRIYAYFNPEYEQKILAHQKDIKEFAYTCDMAQSISMLGGRPPLYILAALGEKHEIMCDIFPLFSMLGQVSFARLYTKLETKKVNDKFREEVEATKVKIEEPEYAKTKDGRKVKRDVVTRANPMLMADVPGAAELMKKFNLG